MTRTKTKPDETKMAAQAQIGMLIGALQDSDVDEIETAKSELNKTLKPFRLKLEKI